jgi:Domain of unknown function (DUF5060)/Protein of unknown function (DUF4038)
VGFAGLDRKTAPLRSRLCIFSRPAIEFFLILLAVSTAAGQNSCDGTPAYKPCELVFEVPSDPNPYASVQLEAEFKSPKFKTFLMPAFWAGGNRMIVRFTPTEAGQWDYRLTSNVAGLSGKQGSFSASASNSPGFVVTANVHHWATDNKQPHLWMGWVADALTFLPEAEFIQGLNTAASNGFTHFRCLLLGGSDEITAAGQPNPRYFDRLDGRLRQIHDKGLTADLLLGPDPAYFQRLLPDWQTRERFVRYLIARYAAFNITWQGFAEWEEAPAGRALLKEIGVALKKLDPYQHPRSSGAKFTSSPLLGDGWMTYVVEGSSDPQIGSIEHQLYQVPFVGMTDAAHLWSTNMEGSYPQVRPGNEAIAKAWFDLIGDTRHWELEPYFDVDGGRSVALEDVEYLVYVEKPAGPVEVSVEKHSYDVVWFNPANGEMSPAKKYKGEHFTGEAPDRSHPWVLLVAREGRKEGMLKSYKFESRPVPVQEVEANTSKVPYEIAQPAADILAAGTPVGYAIKVRKETRATRSMMFLWTGEVPADGHGFRVLSTGAQGTFNIPPVLAETYPAVLSIRVSAINANGKVYSADKVYQLTQ